jgi:hypothetical protein
MRGGMLGIGAASGSRSMRLLVTAGLAAIAIIAAIGFGDRARRWNDELALPSPPLARDVGRIDDPKTPRLTRRVVLIVVDGLGAAEARLPYLDELRRRGVAATARVPYPTISRPNYVAILTGVPPRDSGVRTNRVAVPVAVDTVMDRVRAAGLRVATASDYGSLASLFLRSTASLHGVDWAVHGTRIAPPPPIAWPFDDARQVESLDALGPVIAELVAGDAAFVPVLVLDVDRAGHAAGVGDEYRAAAAAVDRMLRVALAGIDLARDTVIITADHGHVAPGGHGGDEREVSNVPLVLAGEGVVPGAAAQGARLIDIAPTVAALLGVPAPRHAEGRTLVELLRLSPEDAARRSAGDDTRRRRVAEIVVVAHARATAPATERLVMLAAGLSLAAGLVVMARRNGALAVTPASLAGAVGLAAVSLAVVVITRGRMSPSYVPSLVRLERLGAAGVSIAIALQVVASWRVIRRASDRLAAANGLAVVGLGLALAAVTLVRAWFSPPYLDVPGPFWMVALPALDVAAAACALATALTLALVALRRGATARVVEQTSRRR